MIGRDQRTTGVRLLPPPLITALFAALLASHSATAQVSKEERAALIALYESTNGPEWKLDTNWLGEEGTECQWIGVNCYDDSVISIDLAYNDLSGELPQALAALQSLRFLGLRINNIGGGAPGWLADLPSLQALDLGFNPLGGKVPGSLLSSPTLTHVWLNHSQIEALPDDITGENLISLDISFNPISELPSPTIAALPLLQILNASYTQADDDLSDWYDQAMAEAAGNPFPHLDWLNLQGNQLTGQIPAMLFVAPRLNHVWLDRNELTGPLPDTIFTNPSLRAAMLFNNQLSGTLPDPDFIEWLDYDYSQLYIDLSNNTGLTGYFPESLVYRVLLDRMQPLYSGTELAFGDCYGLRQVSTLRPPLTYDPEEPVEVAVWMRNRAWSGTPSVVDTIPDYWAVIPDPDCYCVTENPLTVHSAPVTVNSNTIFRYQLQGPDDPLLAETGQFDGFLVSSHGSGTQLICGDSQGWMETILSDSFSIFQ